MLPYILVALVILTAIGATLAVGFSRENRQANPDYDRQHGGRWARLSLLYILTAVVSLVALILVIID
ncbi:hypothetical protein HGI30_11245 [Paenibacillus albicereus]|uniref:Uncharacterized protein n=1 Tax=Paenibacillus albicereus TaxID=2726185 RepID=A0A6H2GXD0_9BACL|nr:hypothetical protein [Paenibacillus albicereus]QJC52070.1 hypothetical protein HGI30_11245 [Paenibacillus albicereus]